MSRNGGDNNVGTSATRAKNKYNRMHYDRLAIFVPKGDRDLIKCVVRKRGMSTNEFVTRLIYREIGRHTCTSFNSWKKISRGIFNGWKNFQSRCSAGGLPPACRRRRHERLAACGLMWPVATVLQCITRITVYYMVNVCHKCNISYCEIISRLPARPQKRRKTLILRRFLPPCRVLHPCITLVIRVLQCITVKSHHKRHRHRTPATAVNSPARAAKGGTVYRFSGRLSGENGKSSALPGRKFLAFFQQACYNLVAKIF